MPTQSYIALSDAKQLDSQAGLEAGMGALMAGLSGINSISGPGMLDFESCLSLEKLVVDNEICRMVHRLLEGIEPREDFPALPLFRGIATREVPSDCRPYAPPSARGDYVSGPGHRSQQPRAMGRGRRSELAAAGRAGSVPAARTVHALASALRKPSWS